MPWIWLLAAGLCEIVWAVGLKMSDNFRNLTASIWTVAFMLLSFYLLSKAMKSLDLGTSYAVWTGIGAVGTAIVGMAYFHEPRDVRRVACIALIVAGIVGLKLLAAPGRAG